VNAQETRAWLALTANVAVLPGLGTLLLRRWAAALAQLALALAGGAASIAWLLSFLREWSRLGWFPMERGPLFPAGLAGTLAFVGSWAWSAWMAGQEVRASRGR
jgi:hypothetical protein